MADEKDAEGESKPYGVVPLKYMGARRLSDGNDWHEYVVMNPPDFEQIALTIIRQAIDWNRDLVSPFADHPSVAAVKALREVWNARGAADLASFFNGDGERPCSNFEFDAGEPSACRHCGWTSETHGIVAAIKRQDR